MKGQGEAGFTLVESLVAFAILAAAIVLSFQSFGASLHQLRRSQESGRQVQAAEQLMQKILHRKDLQRGQWIETSDGLDWRITVTRKSQAALVGTPVQTPVLLIKVEPATLTGGLSLETVTVGAGQQ